VLLPKKAVLGRMVKWREKRNANLGTITTSEWEYQRAASERPLFLALLLLVVE